jgi:hypothetical protein
MLLHHRIKVKIFSCFGAQTGSGGTHFVCPQITRISKMKNMMKLNSTDKRDGKH